MPLQKQMISLPFTKGLDEKASDKHLAPPSLETCDNGKFSKNGQVQKRNGFTRLTNTSFINGASDTVGASVQCASYRDERLIFDGNNAYTRSTNGNGVWVDKGRITGSTFKDVTVFNDESMTSGPLAAASGSGFRVEAWSESDPTNASLPFLATNNVFHVYARVIDEASNVPVVPKTRITPESGIIVAKSHVQNNDSNYMNPQVQAVTMGNYVFVLFNDCQRHESKVDVTSITDRGGGKIGVVCDANHNYLYQDVVTIAGGTGYDGNYIVTGVPSATVYEVTAVFGSTGTGTSTIKQTYGDEINGVHAVPIATGGLIAAALTPTPLANFNSPAFYINGRYPLFSVAFTDNSTTDDTATPKASVFRFNTGPINDAAATVASYRLDYFEEASGVFQEWEDTAPGYRGRNTPILPADRTAYFQASEAAHNSTERTLSHIALTPVDVDDRLMVVATFQESGVATNPEIRTQMYTGALAKVNTTQLAVTSRCLISASFLKHLTGTDLQFVWTGQAITKGGYISPDSGQAADHALYKADIDTGGNVKSQEILKYFTTLASDLFSYNAKIYFAATYAITPNASLYSGGGMADFTYVNFLSSINLISDTDGNIIATGGTGLGGNCASTDWLPNSVDDRTLFWGVARVTTVSSSKFAYGSSRFSGVADGGSAVYTSASVFNPSYAELDLDPARNLPSADGSGSLLLCGGLLWEYAGDSMKENGFLTYPQTTQIVSSYQITGAGDGGSGPPALTIFQINTSTPHGLEVGDSVDISGTTSYNQAGATVTAVDKTTNTFTIEDTYGSSESGKVQLAGGVLADSAAYKYKIVYEWTNANGDIQRSYPSDGVTATVDGATGSTGRIRLIVYTPQWTQKSLANGLSNPTIVLYRTTMTGAIFHRAASARVDFSASTQSVDDSLVSNNALGDNEPIYSTGDAGDVFGNIAPPCSTDITLHKNRIFLSIIDGSIWYSKKLTPKRGAEFSDLQVKPIENYSASISCIGAVRDYLVVVTTENAYFLAGDGPNAAGIGTDFSPPTIFSRDSGANAGCARGNSPVGFIYRAKGGIYRVSPSMQMEWIGAPVEDTVDEYEPTRVVVNDTQGEVYFGLTSGGKKSIAILVYNYVFNAWSIWKPRYSAFGSVITPTGMMVHDGTLNFSIPNGYLLEQNAGFTDIGSSTFDYSLLVTTPWFRSEQFLHMARFYNILISGTYKSDHTLNCTIYSNYDESITDAQTLVITSANSSPYILRQHVGNQKARAIKLTISDTPTSGSFESYQLDGIGIELGVRAGTFKLGTAKTLT